MAGDRSWHADVSRLRGDSIEADLGERDFTVNAIALQLADGSELIDPQGAAADLEARVLRPVSERALADDPLRILRAARLGAELGFALDPETVRLARDSAARAAEPAGERQLAELRLLLAGPEPLRGLALLDELGATAGVLPELEALRGVGQNPNHHLDVHGHTLEVLANLLEVESDLDRYAGDAAAEVRALLDEPLGDELDPRGRAAVRRRPSRLWQARDAGRARGGLRLLRRPRPRGGADRRRGLRAAEDEPAVSRHLQALTLHHLHLGFMTRERPLTRERLYEYLKLTEPVAADVTLLTVADRLAARGTGSTATPEMIEAHLELAREVLPAALAWHRDGAPKSPIAGNDLAEALGIEEGPELGRLLGEVEKRVFTGEIVSADDAISVACELG